MNLKPRFLTISIIICLFASCSPSPAPTFLPSSALPQSPLKGTFSPITVEPGSNENLPTLQLVFTDKLEAKNGLFEGIYAIDVGCFEDVKLCLGEPTLLAKIPRNREGLINPIVNYDWSPDGEKVVICTEVQNNRGDLLLFDTKKDIWINLTNNPADECNPSWSPNGHNLIYTSCSLDPSPDCRVYQIDEFGSNKQQLLTKYNSSPAYPKWTPDGKQILFVDQDDKGEDQIWIADPDGSNAYQITSEPSNPSFQVMLPDLQSIFFERDNNRSFDFSVIQRSGSPENNITVDLSNFTTYGSVDPLGKWIAYSYTENLGGGSKLMLMSIDGKQIIPSIDINDQFTLPGWRWKKP